MPTGLRAALTASMLLVASCKPHGANGTTTPSQGSSIPHMETGPLPTHPDRQAEVRHTHTGCGLDDRLMGACTGSAPRATHSPWFWQEPSPPILLRQHTPRPRSR